MSLSPALDLVLRYVPSVPYLLGKFKFTTDQAAPLASPYTEGGAVGSLTLTDTGNKLSISGGTLRVAAATVNWTDPRAVGTGLTRQAGRALLFTGQVDTDSNAQWMVGWATGTGGGTAALVHAWYIGNTVSLGPLYWFGTANLSSLSSALSLGTAYEVAVVLRSTGAFLLQKVSGVWTLLWVDPSTSTATMYPTTATGGNALAARLALPRVADLPAPWNGDYGIATQRLAGARSAGDTGAHTANCLLDWTETTIPSAGTTDFRFRVQDASNYWQLTISSTGALTLNEVVAGTPTSRGSSAAAVANGNRVVVVADGSTIKVYVANTSKITYASASNFATATSFSLTALGTSGAISDIVAWPRTVTIGSQY